MANTQPVPAWADPIVGNKEALEQLGIKFNPVWLNWFLTLEADITTGGAVDHNSTAGLQGGDLATSQFYHLTQAKAALLTGNQSANVVFAGPASGAAAAATFRSLVTADLASQIITYAKIQNVSATDKLLGRSTAGAGAVEEITCTGFARTILDDAAASDVRTTLGLGSIATHAYATGSFTPVITFGGGSTGITYSAQTGRYTLTGNRVHYHIYILLTSKGSSTGSALITGLPYTPSNSPASLSFASASVWANSMAAGVNCPIALVSTSATQIFLGNFAAGNRTFLADTDFTNTTQIAVSGSYETTEP